MSCEIYLNIIIIIQKSKNFESRCSKNFNMILILNTDFYPHVILMFLIEDTQSTDLRWNYIFSCNDYGVWEC